MNKHRDLFDCHFVVWCVVLWHIVASSHALAQVVPLDSCRLWALRNNKSLQIAHKLVQQSGDMRRAAQGAYLPGIDFIGTYFYNEKNTRLIDVDKLRTAITDWGVPAAWVSALVPNDLLAFDTHQVAWGALTVTQPIYMGGKIVALNDIASAAERLSISQKELVERDVIDAVDDAYWLVVALESKYELAKLYVQLVDSLHSDMSELIAEGIATKSEGLAVAVAKNEAEVLLSQSDHGLSLARMVLAQLCGLPIDTVFEVQEVALQLYEPMGLVSYGMSGVYHRREELNSLYIMSEMAQAQRRLVLSDMLPTVALVGMYQVGMPNLYNGFSTDLDGMFSVGVVLRVPIFHWGTNYYRYKAAGAAVTIAHIEIEAAKERIDLQVSEARYRYDEAGRTYRMYAKNMEQAELNLRNAQYAFDEGVLNYTQLLAAQVAWRQAASELIDAQIAIAVAYDSYKQAVGLPLY
ncbi:MAG: TolC family protein [Bacteroidaceae bacterium]|nr:TolC family protein [Bacteroidaceae bacterium]